jgi:CRP/FNR family transcriptional regulator, cyclic AMP receptor protein
MIEGLDRIVAAHPLFAGLGDDFLTLVTGCARNVRVKAGAYIFHEGDPADQLYLIRQGLVAMEIGAPGHGRMTFQTTGRGGLVGLSWLVPPYRWTYDARAVEDVRALSFDAVCLRDKCDANPALGYAVMQRFMPVLVERLHNTRLQMLDVYGAKS